MPYNFEIILQNFPDWAIPMTRVVPVIYQTDDKDITTANLFYDFQYWWEKINENDYKLQFYVYVIATGEDFVNEIVLMDLNLYIINEQLIKNTIKRKN